MIHSDSLLFDIKGPFTDNPKMSINMKHGNRRGLASEMRVAADLLVRGYQVYSASRVGNTYDFVITKGDGFITVEVKTSDKLKVFPAMWKTTPQLLALVSYDGRIRYLPESFFS